MRKVKNIVILAGGDGDRFWPVKEKMLTSFLGRPYILHIMESVKRYAETLFIVVNETNKKNIEEIAGSDAQIIIQKQLTGMAGAILSCKGLVTGRTVILGNDLFDFSIIPKLFEKDFNMVLLAKKVADYFPGGYLQLAGDKIIAIQEKPSPDKAPSDMVRLVADYIKDIDAFVSTIVQMKGETDHTYEQALTWTIRNKNVSYCIYTDYWYTLKYPWHLLSLMTFYLSTLHSSFIDSTAQISKTAVISGNVHVGKHVKVGNFVNISGPVFIGEGSSIGDHTLLRNSQIGKNCLIGSGCEVARSYLSDEVMLHRNYIGDSILGQNVLMGAGAVTANFRFDRKEIFSYVHEEKVNSHMNKLGAIIGSNSKVGVNTTLFPGIKIGQDCLVGPGEKVQQDIKDGNVFMNGVIKSKK